MIFGFYQRRAGYSIRESADQNFKGGPCEKVKKQFNVFAATEESSPRKSQERE